MKLEFYPEICCDYCYDIIHNHFGCPVCGDDYARTDMFGSMHDYIEKVGDSFCCEECDSEFVLIEGTHYNGEWELKKEIHE